MFHLTRNRSRPPSKGNWRYRLNLRVFLGAACAALPLAPATIALAPPVFAQNAAETPVAEALKAARPLSYSVTIEPDLVNFVFKGEAEISINVGADTNAITLHARDLKFDSAALISPGAAASMVQLSPVFDPASQTVRLSAANQMPIKAGEYRLKISYAGKINSEESRGLFVVDGRGSFYGANQPETAAVKDRQLFSHAQPNDARSIFPGWDEPSYETPFDAALILPSGVVPVGNMPIAATEMLSDGRILTRFEPTPPMPTYLLFFGAGDFQRFGTMVDGVDYGVIVRRSEKRKDYDIAVNSLPEITRHFATYFDAPYTLPKMDFMLSAKPFTRFLAMENWGAILSSERYGKYEYFVGGGDTKLQIYYVNAHEISHQWIGNVVTPKSWNHLWLSEGLAVHLTDRFLAAKFPEMRLGERQYGLLEEQLALETAKLGSPLQSENSVNYSVDKVVSGIIYGKGGAVFSMLAEALGEEKWRAILRQYVANNRVEAVTLDAMLGLLEAAGEKYAARSLLDYATQPGFPLIRIDAAKCKNNSTMLTLSQRAFPGATAPANSAATRWVTPIFASSKNIAQTVFLTSAQQNITLLGCDAFTLNAKAAGYYRVDYSNVVNTPQFAKFGQLSSADQYGVLLQSFSNADAGITRYRDAFDLLSRADAAALPELQSHIIDKLSLARRVIRRGKDARLLTKIDTLIRKMLLPASTSAESANGGNLGALRELLDLAGEASVRSGPRASLPSRDNLGLLFFRPGAASDARIAFRNVDAPTWQNFVSQLDERSVSSASTYLGQNKDPAIVKRALEFAVTGMMKPYNRSAIFIGAAELWPEMTVDFVLSDPRVKSQLNAADMEYLMRSIVPKIDSKRSIDKIADFAQTFAQNETKTSLLGLIEEARTRIAPYDGLEAELKIWLRKQK